MLITVTTIPAMELSSSVVIVDRLLDLHARERWHILQDRLPKDLAQMTWREIELRWTFTDVISSQAAYSSRFSVPMYQYELPESRLGILVEFGAQFTAMVIEQARRYRPNLAEVRIWYTEVTEVNRTYKVMAGVAVRLAEETTQRE